MTKHHLLVLGSNPETAALVSVAKSEGHLVTVVDPVPHSPAKRFADFSFSLDGFDVEAICEAAQSVGVTGVLIGVLDVLMPSYLSICNRLGLPCYATEESIKVFSSKSSFSLFCSQFGIRSIPAYSDLSVIRDADYPLLVKPIDSGAGIGISIVRDSADLDFAIQKARTSSRSRQILVEKYMECSDMSAYYTFIDGTPCLTATTDRFTSRRNDYGSPVCIGASYPSKFENAFMADLHPKFIALFSALNIQFGVFNVQIFYDGTSFYAYDPGFRLQGEGYHFHILNETGIDQRKMFIDFALGRKNDLMKASSSLLDFRLCRSSRALTIWVLLTEGLIASISGLDKIQAHSACSYILERFNIGDVVLPSMIGTEKQVLCRIYLQSLCIDSILDAAQLIKSSLVVRSSNGSNMVYDFYSPDDSHVFESNF